VGAVVVLVLGAFAVTILIGILRGAGGSAEEIPAPEVSASGTAPPLAVGSVYVHVAGAVSRPGLYSVAAGSRVADALAAAGGIAADGDASAVNLARVVSDGEQIVVPVIGAAPPAGAGPPGTAPDGRIDLNTADQAALETLPRIGPALAARILEWREANGRFQSVEDLLAVPGIGEKVLEGLRSGVRV
jgi:competence protein ComEA